ncbi:MAG: Rab family GTPase [Candidatus Thorarchaeota archaeon]
MSKPAYVYKICVVGDSAVGKTSTIIRWSENRFQENYQSTVGVQHYSRTVEIGESADKVLVKMMIWDLAGQDVFKPLRAGFYDGAKGLIAMYDLSRPETLKSLPGWVKEANEHINEEVPYVIVGNKIDLIPEGKDFPETKKYAESKGAPFMVTSAKTGANVSDLFGIVGKLVHESFQAQVARDKTGFV